VCVSVIRTREGGKTQREWVSLSKQSATCALKPEVADAYNHIEVNPNLSEHAKALSTCYRLSV
jgi:hypothetical protein